MFTCEICKKTFVRGGNLRLHTQRRHSNFATSTNGGSTPKRRKKADPAAGQPLRPSPLLQNINADELYTLVNVSREKSSKFQTTALVYNFKLKDKVLESTLPKILSALDDIFTSLINRITSGFQAGDWIRVIIDNYILDYPIQIPFSKVNELSSESILNEIERVLQSFEDFILDQGFRIDVTHVKSPAGSGRPKGYKQGSDLYRTTANLNDLERNRQCIISITNNDHLCCARALVVGKTLADCNGAVTDEAFKRVRSDYKLQKELALELHAKSGVDVATACDINSIKCFKAVLSEYRIVIVSKEHLNAIIYDTKCKNSKVIILYHSDNHFEIITQLRAFFRTSYYCLECRKGYNNKYGHICGDKCPICKHIHTGNPKGRSTDQAAFNESNCSTSKDVGSDLGRQSLTVDQDVSCSIDNSDEDYSDGEYGDSESVYSDGEYEDSESDYSDFDDEEADNEWLYCSECNRFFRGEECFENHLLKDSSKKRSLSVCEAIKKCGKCEKNIPKYRFKKHVCGEFYCTTCGGFFTQKGHLCYMTPVSNKNENQVNDSDPSEGTKKDPPLQFIFFDFESRQETGKHEPNLCIAHKTCEDCFELNSGGSFSICRSCGTKEKIFYGDTCTDSFCNWLFTKENAGSIVICHNFKGYDSYFILDYIYRKGIKPQVTFNGGKIMTLIVPKLKIKFIDSLNFLPMALAKLPKTFNLIELEKGYFPHLFNKKCNEGSSHVVLPPMHFYCPENMNPNERERFVKWYDVNLSKGFNFDEELISYCRSDVDILERSCIAFRKTFMEATCLPTMSSEVDTILKGIDPFSKCVTIASACNLVFRTQFLKPDTIAVVPPYVPYDNHSIESIEWLTYVEKVDGITIQHARKAGREEKVAGAKVDGFCRETKTVYQYHSCFLHGCDSCYLPSTWNPLRRETMGQLHKKTLNQNTKILDKGFKLVQMWSCNFKENIKIQDSYKQLMIDTLFTSPLQPRDAFCGGRVDCCKTYHLAEKDEVIRYYDFTSLYPYVNKYGLYPLGHHKRLGQEHWEGNLDISGIEGLVKCTVLPPRGLYHPVLPYRCGGKLLFPLCRSCCEYACNLYDKYGDDDAYFKKYYDYLGRAKHHCKHSEENRALTGTWVSCELKKAIQMGYRLTHVYEAWHYEKTTQYNPETREGGLFTDYVNAFLKIKQEKSGWPVWVKTDQDKQKYIDLYLDKEGIYLDQDAVEKNSGMRLLSKLMLNSFWGKFGQRDNMIMSKYIDDVSEYMTLLTDETTNVTNIQLVNENIVHVEYNNKKEFVRPSNRINVVLAAYTTAQARLKLYELLEVLNHRVLYYDTDSVIFTSKLTTENGGAPDKEPSLGDFLGELTNELEDDSYIIEFVSSGPKSYSYRLNKPDSAGKSTHCKVKGIRLSYSVSEHINFESMKDLVLKEIKARETSHENDDIQRGSIVVSMNHQIIREKSAMTIRSVALSKKFQCVFSKRAVLLNMDTVPFGY